MLEKIQSPADLKNLNTKDLQAVVDEARFYLLQKISQHGGHSGPNLGMVEMTVALHYVFNSPVDKLIFDVSHQTYIHKMLTGRAQAFMDPAHYDDVSGYTNPKESDHDLFTIGHTSTSLALASGVARARDLAEETYNVLAIIGDGSLSGGMAYEGLNQIATSNTNTIVIVNDNDHSIAPNPKGGIYTALRNLRQTKGQDQNNFFKALGFDYHYLDEGNDLLALIKLFQNVKDSDKPVLLHIHTQKGKGFKFAEEHRSSFHAGGPFSLETGKYLNAGDGSASYSSVTSDKLKALMAADKGVVVVNAGTPGVVFTASERQALGQQFVDVGIAEQEAATMVTGLAKNGAKPVWAVYSTFMQRAYDQLSHDLALNNLPGVVLVYGASSKFFTDESHLSLFDIPFLAHIPNMVYLAPTNKEEHLAMLDWAIQQNQHPVAIRVPVGPLVETGQVDTTDYSQLNKSKLVQAGSQVALIAVGNMMPHAQEVLAKLAEQGIKASLINPVYLTGLDQELLEDLKTNHKLVLTLEDGLLEGGYGQMVASYYGPSEMKVLNFGIDKAFHDRYKVEDLWKANGLLVDQLVETILSQL